jgi:hypothetical protein
MANLFVLLPAHFDPVKYREDFEAGLAADSSSWGFAHAAKFGHSVRFSPGGPTHLARQVLRRLFAFDMWNALANWRTVKSADYVLTHTEKEFLSAALVLRLSRTRKPVLQGNVLWLFHEFPQHPVWRRALLRWLINRVDINLPIKL